MTRKASFQLKIDNHLYIGFLTLILLLTITVSATVWEVSGINKTTDRIVDLRTPTAQASAALIKQY